MKKVLIVVFVLLIGGFVYLNMFYFPIVAGFGAKALCSCAYLGGREEGKIIKEELSAFPLSLGSFHLSNEEKSATGSVWGLSKAKAVYVEGWGCTLVKGMSEEAFRASRKPMEINKPELSDTLNWPLGTKVDAVKDSTLNMQKLLSVVDNAFVEDDPEKPKNTRAVIIVKDGKLISEKYGEGYDMYSKHIGWSMSKSITATLIGMLQQNNVLNVKDRALVPEWQEEGDPRKEITLDNLLRMHSGLEWEEDYSGPSPATDMLYIEGDMGVYAANFPLEFEIGKEWEYSSGTSNILAYLLRKLMGDQGFNKFPYDSLFYPLGIRSAVIEADASGTLAGSSYMWASARDWARLGQLYLNKGYWNDQQLFEEDWVDYVIEQTPNVPKGRYGAHFWLNAGEADNNKVRKLPSVSRDVYSMNGYDGQRVFVVPSKNMVVVRLGKSRRGHFNFDQFLSELIASVEA